MDAQFALPPKSFVKLASKFVCVRVTDMSKIDLGRYRFDFDLTLAVLLADSQGHVYHRFGGRTASDPSAYMKMAPLQDVMRATLAEHAQRYPKGVAPKVKPRPPARTVYDIPAFAKKMAKRSKPAACIHCHTVHDAQIYDRKARKVFRRESIWIWPSPERIGLTMDPLRQSSVAKVAVGSSAHRAGIRAGDALEKLGHQTIVTVHDLQWVLEQQPFAGGKLQGTLLRAGKSRAVELLLAPGFKRTDAKTYAWRPYKWPLRPAPGFGGPMLSAKAREKLGLPATGWACRVQYIVDWGETPEQGRENRRRGLRKGDVVTSYDGRSDFESMDHFHAWTRLRKKRGERVVIDIRRAGQKQRIEVELK